MSRVVLLFPTSGDFNDRKNPLRDNCVTVFLSAQWIPESKPLNKLHRDGTAGMILGTLRSNDAKTMRTLLKK